MVVCVTYPGIGASELTLDTPHENWLDKFLFVNMKVIVAKTKLDKFL